MVTALIVAAIILAAEVSFDGWSTQYLDAHGFVEEDPLAKSLVKTTGGQIVACLLGLGITMGVATVFHLLHHDVLSQLTAWGVVLGEGINCIRQYTLVKGTEK
jgi:uncharacterized membrane protein